MQTVMLILTMVSGHGELSQREQRMTAAECKAEVAVAKHMSGFVSAICVPMPADKGSK